MPFRAGNRLPALQADRVLFYISHPLTSISRIIAENEKAGRASASFQYRAKLIRSHFDVDIARMEPLAAATLSYICWNRLAEDLAGPNPPIRVEEPDLSILDPGLEIARTIPVGPPPSRKPVPLEAVLASVPRAFRPDFDRYMALYDGAMPAPEVFRNVMLYWADTDPPPSVLKVFEDWKAVCTGWNVVLHSRDSAAEWIETRYGRDIRKLFLACRIPAMQSDVFRVLWAIEEGGVYSDITYAPLRPPEFFDPSRELTAVGKNDGSHFLNSLFYARRDSSELKKIAFHIFRALSLKTDEQIWSATGPGAWAAAIGTEATETIAVVPRRQLLGRDFRHSQYEASTRGSENHWSRLQKKISIYEREG